MKIGVKLRYSRLQNCLIDHIKLFSRPFVEHAIIARGCTELHHIASLGNSDIMEQVLDSLARKGALKIALKMRSRSGMSVLEAALYSNNYGVVKTLLQRAGIWSFQGTQTSKKTAIHVAVASALEPKKVIRAKHRVKWLWSFRCLRKTKPVANSSIQ